MSFGKQQAPTQTTTSQQTLSPQQQELMSLALPGVREFAAKTPVRYQGSTVAGFDPSQTAGQEAVLAAAGAQQGVAQNAADTSNFWTSGNVWDPASNPALQGAIDAAVRPITQQYQETVMPGIRGDAIGAGQSFGGSRRGVAEGIASRGYLNSVGDTSSKLVQDQYRTNVDAQLKALGLTPVTQEAQTRAGLTTSGVGDVRQAMEQAKLNEQVQNFQFDEYAPFLKSKEIMSLMAGLPGGGSTSTSTANVPQQSGLSTAIGAGLTLLPFLLSDRKAKENSRVVGRLFNGLPVHLFNYAGDPVPQIGLMADEVEKVHPDAVMEVGKFKYVDYALAVKER